MVPSRSVWVGVYGFEVVQRTRKALLCGQAIPIYRLDVVLRHALTGIVHAVVSITAKAVQRIKIIMVSALLKLPPVHHLPRIPALTIHCKRSPELRIATKIELRSLRRGVSWRS